MSLLDQICTVFLRGCQHCDHEGSVICGVLKFLQSITLHSLCDLLVGFILIAQLAFLCYIHHFLFFVSILSSFSFSIHIILFLHTVIIVVLSTTLSLQCQIMG